MKVAEGDVALGSEAHERYKNKKWGLHTATARNGDFGVHADHAQLAVLMDIRDRLDELLCLLRERST